MPPQMTAVSAGSCTVAEGLDVMVAHGQAALEPPQPPVPGTWRAALPRSEPSSYAARRAWCQHPAQDQHTCHRDVPFPPAWQLGLGLGSAEPRCAAQHPLGAAGLALLSRCRRLAGGRSPPASGRGHLLPAAPALVPTDEEVWKEAHPHRLRTEEARHGGKPGCPSLLQRPSPPFPLPGHCV